MWVGFGMGLDAGDDDDDDGNKKKELMKRIVKNEFKYWKMQACWNRKLAGNITEVEMN